MPPSPRPAPRQAPPEADQNVGAPGRRGSPRAAPGPAQLVFNDTVTLGIDRSTAAAAPQAVAGLDRRHAQDGYYAGKTCHRLANSARLRVHPVRIARRRRRTPTPTSRYGPVENAPADERLPGRHHRDGPRRAATRTATDTSSSSSPATPRSRPTPPAATPVVGTVTSGLDKLIADITSAGIDPRRSATTATGSAADPHHASPSLTLQ